MTHLRRLTSITVQAAILSILAFGAGRDPGGRDSITPQEMREWLTYLASDELEGRNTFSEGLGLAAAYIADQLRAWGVKPGGDAGSYFQRVRILGVKSTNNSTVTVEAAGRTRTFKNGQGVVFQPNVGARRAITGDQIEFMGYGFNASAAGHNDYQGKSVKGKVVVWLGGNGPRGLNQQTYRRLLFGRSRYATEQEGAVASIGPVLNFGRSQGDARPATAPVPTPTPGGQAAPADQGAANPFLPRTVPVEASDFTTPQRLDNPIPPAVSAGDDFFDFLFTGQEMKYAELKEKAQNQKALPRFTLKNVKITINLDAEYRVVRTQYTRNVIGTIEGTDPKLKSTYVAFGAHYDHVGYAEGEIVQTENGPRRAGAVGRVKEGAIEDRIWNGADDDGSGTVTELAVAKAFALGPKPRRSLLFVWHSGEEKGLLGSRYYADYPTLPIDSIVAQVNMDMVGRNRDDKPDEANTLYLVGSDRISTELHNLTVDANEALGKPLKLDYEMNDPTDLEQVYYRSDHYSYAAKGIPIVFLTTGLHSDYHVNTDSAEKINYEKMASIGQLVYEIGLRIGNLDHAPARDNRGPRVGKGSSGKLKI